MKMETTNKTLENLQKLKKMFPEVFTESKDENGEIVAAVDAKKLEQLLSTKVIDGDESYDFTWVGKKQAMIEACKPIRKTLRPCREESVDWENTQNLYIEGDNLDVLKLLQESYLNKVKMIYIDPPYNTGNDSFIYPDDYSTNKDAYDEEVGAIDESGYRMFKNTETNGRFHSSWCSMMYPRLKLARNLLSEDGVIFISIDDHEVDNLQKVCDEVFGESNFVNKVVWIRNSTGKTVSKQLTVNIEYLLIYGKNTEYEFSPVYKPLSESTIKMYSKDDNDGRGKYRLYPLQKPAAPGPETTYDYVDNDGKIWKCPAKGWRMKESKLRELENDGRLCKENGTLSEKAYWNERTSSGRLADTLWNDLPENSVGTNEIIKLFDGKAVFSNPKPTDYIKRMMLMQTSKENCIILDFFAGSCSTAHTMLKLNAEDGGKRKFIMVQLPEVCDEKSEAYKAGYKNICEIGKERIRRAGKKIVEENGKIDLDIGFRVLKLDDGNMKDVYYTPEEYNQKDLVDMASNIKDDRTPEDLLYACMLEWGLELSLPHKVQTVAGYNVHIVDDGALVACFDDKISEDAIKQIAELQPLRAVFRDSGFAGDAARVNVGEIFKLKSPNTTIKVL